MIRDNFKNFLDNKNCLKIICGAGNKDLKEITNLCALYATAGCRFFDVNASLEAIKAAKDGLKFAGKESECFICVSVGTNDDPHFVKCRINTEKCINCGECEKKCLQKAIRQSENGYVVNEDKCVGCNKCLKVCSHNAVDTYCYKISISEVLPPLINEGFDCLEYHIITDDENKIFEGWETIKKLYKGPVSICLDRSKFGNEKVENCLKKMKDEWPDIFIVQADGAPMSGGDDDFRTTLQAVAMADIVDKAGITPYILISGGTNSKTNELSDLCDIDVTGVSLGSYARKIVKEYIEDDNFLTDKCLFERALKIAKRIV
ncbi:4Fe-4S binding protein [bacterium]|nr:4Fe-4S binding protein [bacterium]